MYKFDTRVHTFPHNPVGDVLGIYNAALNNTINRAKDIQTMTHKEALFPLQRKAAELNLTTQELALEVASSTMDDKVEASRLNLRGLRLGIEKQESDRQFFSSFRDETYDWAVNGHDPFAEFDDLHHQPPTPPEESQPHTFEDVAPEEQSHIPLERGFSSDRRADLLSTPSEVDETGVSSNWRMFRDIQPDDLAAAIIWIPCFWPPFPHTKPATSHPMLTGEKTTPWAYPTIKEPLINPRQRNPS